MAKALRLKNFQLLPLATWLGKLQLHGAESRYRTRFIKLLSDRIEEMDKERILLCEKYQDKNKKKEPIYLDKDGKDTTDKANMSSYKITDMDGFNKEYLVYLNEEFAIEITASNQDTIYGVRGSLLNTDEKFSGQEAALYEAWSEAFEAINK